MIMATSFPAAGRYQQNTIGTKAISFIVRGDSL